MRGRLQMEGVGGRSLGQALGADGARGASGSGLAPVIGRLNPQRMHETWLSRPERGRKVPHCGQNERLSDVNALSLAMLPGGQQCQQRCPRLAVQLGLWECRRRSWTQASADQKNNTPSERCKTPQ